MDEPTEFTDELPTLELDKDFGDTEILFNLRDWLQSAVEAKGAKVTGGGLGFGGADLDIEIDGFPYFLHIKPK